MTPPIKLPKPQKDLDFPLMKALELCRTKRKWQESNLSDQEISNLLWAACGVTLPETKGGKSRWSAPSAFTFEISKIIFQLSIN